MIKKILRYNTSQLRESILYYIGNFALNFFRYLFHLFLLRFLTPPEYGEFLSYLSLMYILAIPTGTIGNLVTKFIAEYKGKNEPDSINIFFYYLLKKTAPVGLVFGLLLVIFSTPLATLFKAHPLAFVVLGVSTFISLFQIIVGSFLIGFQKFLTQTVLGLINVISTILFALFFIRLGYGATGAVLGQIFSGVLLTLLTLYFIKDSIYPMVKPKSRPNFSLKSFTFYSFIYSLGTMSLLSTDVLAVRTLFDTHTSGLYASLSILGRMILFGLTPLIGLVLPMASMRFAAKSSSRSLLLKLGLGIFCLGLIGALTFTFFSNTIITLLSGSQYLAVSHLLPLFAFTMVAFALSQLILSFLMATGREKANYLYLLAAMSQPIAIYFLGRTLDAVVLINFILQGLLLSSLTIYLLSPQFSKLKFIYGS